MGRGVGIKSVVQFVHGFYAYLFITTTLSLTACLKRLLHKKIIFRNIPEWSKLWKKKKSTIYIQMSSSLWVTRQVAVQVMACSLTFFCTKNPEFPCGLRSAAWHDLTRLATRSIAFPLLTQRHQITPTYKRNQGDALQAWNIEPYKKQCILVLLPSWKVKHSCSESVRPTTTSQIIYIFHRTRYKLHYKSIIRSWDPPTLPKPSVSSVPCSTPVTISSQP